MKTIKQGIQGIFFILLILILIVKALYLFELVPTILAVAGCLAIFVLLLGLFLGKKHVFKITENIISTFDRKLSCNYIYIYIYIIIFAVALLSKLVPILLFDIVSIYDGSDIQVYTETAYELAHIGKAQTYAGYCSSFSHIYWFSVFLSPVAKLFGISQTAFSVYLAICSAVSTLLIFDVLMHTMSPGKSIISIAIYTFLPSQILLPQFITHEQAMLLFSSIAIWLYNRLTAQRIHSIVHTFTWIGFLLSLLFTMLVNTAGVVLSIAVCMMILLFPEKGKRNHIRSSMLKCAVILSFLVIGNCVCADIQEKHSDVRTDYVRSNKYLWTLFVGANADTKAAWSAADGDTFSSYAENASEEDIEAFRQALVINRYRELLHSPDKLMKLIKDKLITIWALLVYPTGYANETISSETTAAFYNRFLFKPLVLIEYAVMLILTLLHILNSIYRKATVHSTSFLFELYLLGMTALLLLTECRNKYTIPMQVFYIALCVGSLNQHIKDSDLS